jgi:outer membrane lipoprotein SlyB
MTGSRAVKIHTLAVACIMFAALASLADSAAAQTSVSYGRITAVNAVNQSSQGARTGGALIGGTIGAAAGSGRSGSNRALGGIGGAFAGQQIGRLASQSQAFEYTILLGGTRTVQMVTDQSGLRIGDCVSVEQGAFNNLRLVADAKCAPSAPKPTTSDVREANACDQAKEQLLSTNDQQAFDLAERRVRLLCGH